jgi:hypothetical protein
MCTACGPFGPWVQAGSRRDFPGSLKGRPQHRSLRACRRHEHRRQLPPHGRADPAPCSFPSAVLRREVPSLSAEHRKAQQRQSGSGPGDPGVGGRAFDAALESRAAIAIKGAPDQHAEGQPSHGMRTVSTARSRDVPAICGRWRTAVACPCSPTRWDTPGSPSRFASAPPGSKRPACGCGSATRACWPSTTSTAGSSAATRSRWQCSFPCM